MGNDIQKCSHNKLTITPEALEKIAKYRNEGDYRLPAEANKIAQDIRKELSLSQFIKHDDKNLNCIIDLSDSNGNIYNKKYRPDLQEVSDQDLLFLVSFATYFNEPDSVNNILQVSGGDVAKHEDTLNRNDTFEVGQLVLPWGLTVISSPRPGSTVVLGGFLVKTGEADAIYAHVGEHVNISRELQPGAGDFRTVLAAQGAGFYDSNNTQTIATPKDNVFYGLFSKPEKFEELFLGMDTFLSNSSVDAEQLKREVEETIPSEIGNYGTNPSTVIYNLSIANAFKDSPIGRAIGGNLNAMKGFTTDDLKNHLDNNYVPNNMICGAVGGEISLKKLIGICSQSKLATRLPAFVERSVYIPTEPSKDTTLQIMAPGDTFLMPGNSPGDALSTIPPSNMTEVRIIWKTPALPEHMEDLQGLAALIQRRALETLKQDGAATYKLSDVSVTFQTQWGQGWITASLSGEDPKKVLAAVAKLELMVQQVRKRPLSLAEIKATRASKATEDTKTWESMLNTFRLFGDARYTNIATFLQENPGKLSKVSPASIQRAAQKYMEGIGDHIQIHVQSEVGKSQFIPDPKKWVEDLKAISRQNPPPYATSRLKGKFQETKFPEDVDLAKIVKSKTKGVVDGTWEWELVNGLRVTVSERKYGKLGYITLSSPFGNATDPLGFEGLRAFLAKTIFLGAKDIPLKSFNQRRDQLGATFKVEPTVNDFQVSVEARSENIVKSLDLLLDGWFHLRLTEKNLTAVEAEITAERTDLPTNDPAALADAGAAQKLGLQRPPLGDEFSIGEITAEDLKNYNQMIIDPSKIQAHIVIGSESPDPQKSKKLRKLFYRLAKIPTVSSLPPVREAPENSVTEYPLVQKAVPLRDPEISKILRDRFGVTQNVEVYWIHQAGEMNYVSFQTIGTERKEVAYPKQLANARLWIFENFFEQVYKMSDLTEQVPEGTREKWRAKEGKAIYQIAGGLMQNGMGMPTSVELNWEYSTSDNRYHIYRGIDGAVFIQAQRAYHKPYTQEENRERVQGDFANWEAEFETTAGQAKNSVEQSTTWMTFSNPDGSKTDVHDTREIYRRLAELNPETMTESERDFFDSKNDKKRRVIFIVGSEAPPNAKPVEQFIDLE